MGKSGIKLIVCLVILGLAGFFTGRWQECINIKKEAQKAVQAIASLNALEEAGRKYKLKHGVFPDEVIYKLWGQIDKNKKTNEKVDSARKVFRSVYDSTGFDLGGLTLTKNFGLSDGKWVMFLYSNLRKGYEANGLVSQVIPGVNYMQKSVTASPLDFLVDYRPFIQGQKRVIEVKCLPAGQKEVKVCKKVFHILRKKSGAGAEFVTPDKIEVNTVVF